MVNMRDVYARSDSDEAISLMDPVLRLLRSFPSLAMTTGKVISRRLFNAPVSPSV